MPTLTQGEKAAADIIKALGAAERIPGVEAILLSRGGGSLEDMWCFNDERLARKIFSMETPVISGVGHEIDFTISDFVADLRAPTPSAAAELVCKNVEEVKEKINQTKKRLLINIKNRIIHSKSNILHLSKRLVDPRRKFFDMRLKVDDLLMRAQRAIVNSVNNHKTKLSQNNKSLKSVLQIFEPKNQKLVYLKKNLDRAQRIKLESSKRRLEKSTTLLEALSPFGVLDRGYSIVSDSETGKILRDAGAAQIGKDVKVRLAKGSFVAGVKSRSDKKVKKELRSGDAKS